MPTTPNTIRIALIQHACAPQRSASDQLRQTEQMIRDAAAQGAQIIATQELFTCPYFPQTQDERHFALAEPLPGPTSDRMCKLARQLKVHIIVSLFEKRAAGTYHNTCILIDGNGKIAGQYRKMHIPDDPRFYEKYYFTPGDLGWAVLAAGDAKVGLLICWDQWFPEAARLAALRGAQIIFYPTAIGWIPEDSPAEHTQQKEAWLTVQRAHAITNGVFVAAINRVGVEDELTFWGSSFVADPAGTVIAQAEPDREQILIADCDLSLIEHQRQGWPFMRDRRVDAYAGLSSDIVD